MRDIFGDEWPDVRQTKERRAEFIAAELARMPKPVDPLTDTPAQEQRRREEAARSALFWRQRERRPLAARLGLHSIDQRVQYDDPPLLPERQKAEAKNGKAQQRDFDPD